MLFFVILNKKISMMQTSLNVNLSLSFYQLVELTRQLPIKERAELASILIDDEPSKEQICKG